MIRVLVEDFHVDVNARSKHDTTALHVLAESQHWWHASAPEYLLQHGVSSEIKNETLHVSIHSRRGEIASEILLRHGADPNFISENGLTCLNRASQYPIIVRDLIKYGANVSIGKKPFVFDAIAALDLGAIDLLVDMGTDFNIKPEPEQEPKLGDNEIKNHFMKSHLILQQMTFHSKGVVETSYPIPFAAYHKFNTAGSRPKIIPIIKSLLKGGAGPFCPYNSKGDSILHELCENEGIIEPLLSLPNFHSISKLAIPKAGFSY